MDADIAAAYLVDVAKTFRNYKKLGERALAQAPDEALHIVLDANSNSIAVVVKHVGGNLRSRFRDFLTSDGEKPDRNRDGEFEMAERASRAQMMQWWEAGWTTLLAAID